MALVSVPKVFIRHDLTRNIAESSTLVLGEDEGLELVFVRRLVLLLVIAIIDLQESSEVMNSDLSLIGTKVYVGIIVLVEGRLKVIGLTGLAASVRRFVPVSLDGARRSITLQPVKDLVKELHLLIVSFVFPVTTVTISVRIEDTLRLTTEGNHLGHVLVEVAEVGTKGIDQVLYQVLIVSTKRTAKITLVGDLVIIIS